MSASAIYLLVYLGPALLILVTLQVVKLRAQATTTVRSIGFARLALAAMVSVLVGILIGVAFGYTVMFGPSYASGDFIGLPWITMLPAMAIGIWTYGKVSKVIGVALVNSLGMCQSKGKSAD